MEHSHLRGHLFELFINACKLRIDPREPGMDLVEPAVDFGSKCREFLWQVL